MIYIISAAFFMFFLLTFINFDQDSSFLGETKGLNYPSAHQKICIGN